MGPMIMPPPMPSMPDSTPAPTDATDNSAQVRAVHGMSPSANAYPRATLRWCPRWLRPAKCKSVESASNRVEGYHKLCMLTYRLTHLAHVTHVTGLPGTDLLTYSLTDLLTQLT